MTTARINNTTTWFTAFFAMAILATSVSAVEVQDLTRLKGSETSKIVGMGLVVGLNGTGDGNGPAMRALAAVTRRLMDTNTITSDLKNAKNVAVVYLSVELPANGWREGDRLDVHLSAPSAKSLEGGRLFLTPMVGPNPKDPILYAHAEGPVSVENLNSPNVAVVRNGAQLVRDMIVNNIDSQGRLNIIINDNSASWPVANNIANHINGDLSPDGPNIAIAIDPKNIIIQVPEYERADPATFISQILQIHIDPDFLNTPARVVINEKTGTIVMTGDVQFSPVAISHEGMTITSITPRTTPTAQNPQVQQQSWVGLDPQRQGGTPLADLLAAFNQLKVDANDRIAIIKAIDRANNLHAQLIFE